MDKRCISAIHVFGNNIMRMHDVPTFKATQFAPLLNSLRKKFPGDLSSVSASSGGWSSFRAGGGSSNGRGGVRGMLCVRDRLWLSGVVGKDAWPTAK